MLLRRMFQALRGYWSSHGPSVLLLTAMGLVANFLHFQKFGLYEDDWYYIAPAWVIPPSAWFPRMFQSMRSFYVGRPLQECYLDLAGYLSFAFRSIQLLYVIAAILYCVAVILMYHVLRLRYPAFFATLASLLFAISPLTTIRQYLDGTLWSAPAFICLFLAILLYSRRRRLLSYVLIVMVLVTYEPMFFVFSSAPFFQRGRKTRGEWARHLAVWAAILFAYLVVRGKLSEKRLSVALSRNPLETARHIVGFAVFQMWSSFLSYGYAVVVSLREKPIEGIAWTIVFALPLLVWLIRSPGAMAVKPSARSSRLRGWWWARNGLAPGLVLIVLGYSVSYFSSDGFVVYLMSGRVTRFSLAAAFGSSVFAAALFCLVLTLLRRTRWSWVVRAGGVTFLMFLFLYSFVIQDDYIREWAHHQSLLAQTIALSPDVTRETFFVMEREPEGTLFGGGPRKLSIGSEPHGLQVSMQRLFEKDHGPEIFVAYNDQWRNYLRLGDDGRVYWTQERFPGGWARDTKAPVGPIISLVERNGRLLRIDTPLYVGGRQVIQIRDPQGENPANGSNWSRFAASPLVSFALPGLAFETAAGKAPHAGK